LQWRLPFFASLLVVIVVAVVVALAYAQFRTVLRRGAGERGSTAATQLASLLAQAADQRLAEARRLAANPSLIAAVEDATPATLTAARDAISTSQTSGPQIVQLWSSTRQLVLSTTNPAAAGRLPELPAVPREGAGALQKYADRLFVDFVVPVRPTSAAQPSGFVVLRRPIMLSGSPQTLNRLVGGGDARIEFGNRAGDVWTDGARSKVPPSIDLARPGVATHAVPGDRRIGALAEVSNTPWLVWVDYSEAQVLAPARTLLRGTMGISTVFLLVAVLLVRRWTRRITEPLAHVTGAAEAFAAGDYTRRVDIGRRDEIGRLAEAFNGMAAQVARDMTARQSAEHALRDREASFRALFAANPLPMWVYDLSTLRFLEVNAAAITHYGYSRDEFLSRRISDIRPPEDVPRLLASVGKGRDHFQRSGIWRHQLKSGEVIEVEIDSHSLTFDGREAALVVAKDVTAQRRLEEQLRQSQKMEALGQLAGGIAHDFNNLLTAIIGYSEFLATDAALDARARKDLEEIRKAGDSAARLTRQLLTFSRRQLLELELLNLNTAVERASALLRRVIGDDIELETRLDAALDSVKADPGQIEQIIMNLAVNARDAMPDGGRLTIETANVALAEPYVSDHHGATPGPHVMLAVSDTGIGMDAATRSRLFEPFFTTKGVGHGTGLGLATVYGIVKQSRGSIYVYSEPGQGTTFKVYFPRATGGQPPIAVTAAPSVLEGVETILIAEDQPDVRALTRSVLERYGYTVLEASDGEEALRVLREHRRSIALVLTDVVMPTLGGGRLAQEVDDVYPHMKVLYTSGYTDDAIVRQGILQDGVAFIAKPFTPVALAEKVREVLDAGSAP
jgi:PAS domain S-box-containing protein